MAVFINNDCVHLLLVRVNAFLSKHFKNYSIYIFFIFNALHRNMWRGVRQEKRLRTFRGARTALSASQVQGKGIKQLGVPVVEPSEVGAAHVCLYDAPGGQICLAGKSPIK